MQNNLEQAIKGQKRLLFEHLRNFISVLRFYISKELYKPFILVCHDGVLLLTHHFDLFALF